MPTTNITTTSTGIYSQTTTSFDPRISAEELAACFQNPVNPFDLQSVLSAIEENTKCLLNDLGVIFTASPPRIMCEGYEICWFGCVPVLPKQLFRKPELNKAVLSRAISVLAEICDIRAALSSKDPQAAVLVGIGLGRVFEKLLIASQEPNAALGRVDRQARMKGTNRANAAKKKRAKMENTKIIEQLKVNESKGWGRKKHTFSYIAQGIGCSDSKVRKVAQARQREMKMRQNTKR